MVGVVVVVVVVVVAATTVAAGRLVETLQVIISIFKADSDLIPSRNFPRTALCKMIPACLKEGKDISQYFYPPINPESSCSKNAPGNLKLPGAFFEQLD